MSAVPSPIHAPTKVRLDHQFKDWEQQLYVHPPEFEAEFDRLMADTPPSGYSSNGLEYHSDWKS